MQTNQEALIAERRTRLVKAAWGYAAASSAGSFMNQGYAKKMFRTTTKKSVALSDFFTFGIDTPTYKIPNILIAQGVLKPGVEGEALPDAYHTTPTAGKVEYTAKLYKAKIGIPDGTFEDNVEEEAFKNTIQDLISETIKTDMEWIAFEGDTASTTPTLLVQDGLFKLATSHEKAGGSAKLTKTILRSAWKMMPQEFRAQKREMRIYTGANVEEDYDDSLGDVATDKSFAQIQGLDWVGPYFKKMPVLGVPMIAQNLGGGTESHALICHPKNATLAIYKKVELELSRDADAGIWNLHARIRFGIQWAEENGVVEITALAAAA
jgi:hypothetical protein